MLSNFIEKLRKKHDWTQEDLAQELDMSRPTYIQIEQGERDLTISEAKKLADVFGLSLENFLNEEDASPNVAIERDRQAAKQVQTMRINVPQKKIVKFKEVLLYVLTKIGGKPNVGETVLYKLLYFIDFDFYEKYEEQLIGATYIKNHHGPTPIEFKKIVEHMIKDKELVKVNSKYFDHDQKKYLALRDPDLSKLDALELQHIDHVLARLGDKNANEISDYSHEDVPWLITEKNKPIDYEAVFYRTPKTSVRNYDDNSEDQL